ncbi:NAD(+) diphosphatase [Streptomonospora sp. NEAU-YY374]|uniref:NAD(+) diphosphatase n=1 Tax=Streptomonospora nanhaiensis TaxID=1323731 RepID=A0A853BT82_9ACTN|nr:NAD(+) diphosphatase [Streptomonospora nanhaiensis]MBV2362726.1 NAD(+) diphosphatase [Streptomonospora nanhaiensis]MBX9390977.1 NAD(+) diphosphatase [Streptomonospora nanhaiensis]NYI97925.1 NAD+ diphosphatase [Streptomonospora nanhaiensis]
MLPPEEIPALSRGAVDLAGHRRTDDAWLDKSWADPGTRVLVLEGGDPASYGWQALLARQSRALVADGAEGGPRLVFVSPAEAPEGERFLLGADERDGTAYFAVVSAAEDPFPRVPGARPVSLREVGALLDDRDAGLFTHAVAVANWNATHRFCPACGGPTEPSAAGHVRVCVREGRENFPRTDPAVIMLVHREADGVEECLLGHNPRWPEHRYSVLAGFVEPGESLEQAVVREVAEEVGIAVAEPRYLTSQPWPFPRSLMLGFFARATGPARRTDAEEISEVRWLSRPALRAAAESGEVLLPGPVSIARRLIEHWYGGPLPGGF